MAAPALSPDCLGWVRAAGYAWSTDDSTDTLVLRSQMGPPTTRYLIRQVRDRLRLTQADDDAEERTLLYAADREVLERFLYGVFGDDIRDDLGLPYLELPWAAEISLPGSPSERWTVATAHCAAAASLSLQPRIRASASWRSFRCLTSWV